MLLGAYLKPHEVSTAESGVLGLEQFRSEAWDAVITDGKLGDMTGLDLAAAIKETHPLTPVILITGSDYALPDTTGGRSPIDAMLTKPFGRMAIIAALQRVCGSE